MVKIYIVDRRWGIFLIVLAILLIGILLAVVLSQRPPQQIIFLQPTSTPVSTSIQSPTPTPTPTPIPRISDLIVVTSPTPNQIITSPQTISGQARGPWFFEATAPVRLLDGNGVNLATGFITAQGDWQTNDFVPFTETLNFSTPSTDTGQLVFENANPSGLSQNRRQIVIPIRFR